MLKDISGFFILTLLIAVLYFCLPSHAIPLPLYFFIWMIWVVVGIFIWRHPNAPSTARGWIYLTFFSIVVGASWYGYALSLGHIVFSAHTLETSNFIDLMIAFLLSPGLTFIAVAGAIRAVFYHYFADNQRRKNL